MIELIDREQVLQTFDQYCERCDQPYRGDGYLTCKHCRFRDARSIIRSCPAGVSMSQWIPCSERLPEEEVICCDIQGEIMLGYVFVDIKSDSGFSAENEICFMYECCAWMPKPEPYKGVDR